MTFQTIRSAQQAIWPTIKESLDIIRAQRHAVADNPEVATKAAKARARLPWNRVVANEAVWAIAKADLLATPEQAEVVQAAREWALSWTDPPTEREDEPEDVALYNAVQALATAALEIPDDE